MSKWKWHFILVCIFVVLNEKDILFWILQYYCMWPDWPQYMDLWVIEKNLCGPLRLRTPALEDQSSKHYRYSLAAVRLWYHFPSIFTSATIKLWCFSPSEGDYKVLLFIYRRKQALTNRTATPLHVLLLCLTHDNQTRGRKQVLTHRAAVGGGATLTRASTSHNRNET